MKFRVTLLAEVETDTEGEARVQEHPDGNLYDTMTGDEYSCWSDYWEHQIPRELTFTSAVTGVEKISL